jgi:16S rRNA (adenine(1408)-N(1))-methyltransferase
VDANADGLREVSGRAARAGVGNLVLVRAAIEALPSELSGVADRLTIVLPWGSLLTAVALPSVPLLRHIRALCQPEAAVTVLLGVDPVRDRAEMRRLGIAPLEGELRNRFAGPYAEAGFDLAAVGSVSPDGLALWPSTWARRLAHGRPRSVFQIDARARPRRPTTG